MISSKNYGSTTNNMSTQCYASFGDVSSRGKRIDVFPNHTDVNIFDGAGIDIQCSDGFVDLIYNYEILEVVDNWNSLGGKTAQSLCDALWNKALQIAKETPMFRYNGGQVTWDDVSLVVIITKLYIDKCIYRKPYRGRHAKSNDKKKKKKMRAKRHNKYK